MFILPEKVTIIEVGPRDGLQNEKNIIPEETKLSFIEALQNAGIQEMEITSFVSPKWVPQMADAKKIVQQSRKIGRQFVLTPNAKGVQLAQESGAQSVAVFIAVSNSFNKKNINCTTAEALDALQPLIAQVKMDGIFVRACISTAFYCPYEGKIEVEDVVSMCKQLAHFGVHELSVADTIGMATPVESYLVFKRLKEELPHLLVTAHFHDTRKLAIANIFATMQAGIDRFDTSAGGIGGCPFAPGATGNVATEDVVNLCDRLGIYTNIDVNKVCEAVAIIEPLLSIPVESGLYKLYKTAQV